MQDCGQLFLIVGNSGSGKDTLLKEVLRLWPGSTRLIRNPQRYITRPAHASEPFISVTSDEFEDLKQAGKFWLTWHVYNTEYGIPVAIFDWLKQGDSVIVNVSRQIIREARQQLLDLKVIFISVPLELTLQRIKSRNRESVDDPGFQQRLARAKENQTLTEADFVVDNSVSLEIAAEDLLNYMLSYN